MIISSNNSCFLNSSESHAAEVKIYYLSISPYLISIHIHAITISPSSWNLYDLIIVLFHD